MNLVRGIEFEGHWADCGTIESLLETSNLMKSWGMGRWLSQVKE
jgi:NDP-sugar pyrophosphorylase family protein